jgi:hypothetical protein
MSRRYRNSWTNFRRETGQSASEAKSSWSMLTQEQKDSYRAGSRSRSRKHNADEKEEEEEDEEDDQETNLPRGYDDIQVRKARLPIVLFIAEQARMPWAVGLSSAEQRHRCGDMWRDMSKAQKQPYVELYEKDRALLQEALPILAREQRR